MTRDATRPRVLVMAPAFNEEHKIVQVVQRVKTAGPWDLVVVDDGSTDRTAEVAREAGAIVIQQPKNMGVGAAIRAGIHHGLSNGYDIGVVISGDDQHDPTEIPRLVDPIVADQVDFVQGSRYLEGGRRQNMTALRSVLTRLYPFIFRVLSGRWCSDVTNGLRAFRFTLFRSGILDIDQDWLDRYELEPYMLFKVYQSQLRVTEVPITIRYHTEKNVKHSKMVPILDWWRILRPPLYLALGIKK